MGEPRSGRSAESQTETSWLSPVDAKPPRRGGESVYSGPSEKDTLKSVGFISRTASEEIVNLRRFVLLVLAGALCQAGSIAIDFANPSELSTVCVLNGTSPSTANPALDIGGQPSGELTDLSISTALGVGAAGFIVSPDPISTSSCSASSEGFDSGGRYYVSDFRRQQSECGGSALQRPRFCGNSGAECAGLLCGLRRVS